MAKRKVKVPELPFRQASAIGIIFLGPSPRDPVIFLQILRFWVSFSTKVEESRVGIADVVTNVTHQ